MTIIRTLCASLLATLVALPAAHAELSDEIQVYTCSSSFGFRPRTCKLDPSGRVRQNSLSSTHPPSR